MAQEYHPCPFDGRLPRIPYLVLPKLAIQVMPYEWRVRFDAMLQEMEDAGIETPAYSVVRAGGTISREFDEDLFEDVAAPSIDDPWADYRHMQREKVARLCPRFVSADERPNDTSQRAEASNG